MSYERATLYERTMRNERFSKGVRMEISDQQFRQFARTGARDVAVRIVTEFPDILPELNALAGRKGAVQAEAPATNGHGGRPRRTMSPAARRRIQAGQRKRWATWRKTHGTP